MASRQRENTKASAPPSPIIDSRSSAVKEFDAVPPKEYSKDFPYLSAPTPSQPNLSKVPFSNQSAIEEWRAHGEKLRGFSKSTGDAPARDIHRLEAAVDHRRKKKAQEEDKLFWSSDGASFNEAKIKLTATSNLLELDEFSLDQSISTISLHLPKIDNPLRDLAKGLLGLAHIFIPCVPKPSQGSMIEWVEKSDRFIDPLKSGRPIWEYWEVVYRFSQDPIRKSTVMLDSNNCNNFNTGYRRGGLNWGSETPSGCKISIRETCPWLNIWRWIVSDYISNDIDLKTFVEGQTTRLVPQAEFCWKKSYEMCFFNNWYYWNWVQTLQDNTIRKFEVQRLERYFDHLRVISSTVPHGPVLISHGAFLIPGVACYLGYLDATRTKIKELERKNKALEAENQIINQELELRRLMMGNGRNKPAAVLDPDLSRGHQSSEHNKDSTAGAPMAKEPSEKLPYLIRTPDKNASLERSNEKTLAQQSGTAADQ